MKKEVALNEQISMLHTMIKMQEEHNLQVHPEWIKQGYEFYRAMWVECAEMLDHFGWKWWKQQNGDLDQVKLELVDIWHFAISEILRQHGGTIDAARAQAIVAVLAAPNTQEQSAPANTELAAEQFRLSIEALALSCLQSQSFELEPFKAAMDALPLPYEEMFALYIGKNILNRFRQANGYKSGEYRKLWQGREDNEHLIELLAVLGGDPDSLPDRLYQGLEGRYQEG